MSRIGKLPVQIPDNVNVNLENKILTVKGPKGELRRQFVEQINIAIENKEIVVSRMNDEKISRSLHGLTRTLIANMVEGVSNGFTKKLEIVGVGYKAETKGSHLVLHLGFSHPIVFSAPEDITINVPGPNEIHISGINKELVGMIASKLRSYRKPEPYKGKGVKYAGEHIRRKAGKTAGK